MSSEIQIRSITPEDNPFLAGIIRQGISALGLPEEGTAFSDPTTDRLYELFQTPNSFYFVLEQDSNILGGCGIYPSSGLPPGCAELVRFFLHPAIRGKGFGHILMKQCEKGALELGYTHIYLESFPEMKAAIHLYKKYGFQALNTPLGNTGHYSCNVWMLKEIADNEHSASDAYPLI